MAQRTPYIYLSMHIIVDYAAYVRACHHHGIARCWIFNKWRSVIKCGLGFALYNFAAAGGAPWTGL